MKNFADLYARLPLGVARLEGKLAESGGLSLRYVAVGERVLSRAPALLDGECEGATHYVQAMVLGAFDLETRTSRTGGADVRALGAGAGGTLETRRELAGSAGDVARCRERGSAPISFRSRYARTDKPPAKNGCSPWASAEPRLVGADASISLVSSTARRSSMTTSPTLRSGRTTARTSTPCNPGRTSPNPTDEAFGSPG